MNRKSIKKAMLMLLVACMCILSVPATAGASTKSTKAQTTAVKKSAKKSAKKVKVGTTTPTKFRFWKNPPRTVTGCYYRSTWKKVKGASGYQVQMLTYSGGSPYKRTFRTKKCYATFGSSDTYKAKIRVRAYKKVGSKYVYGAYSKWITANNLLR